MTESAESGNGDYRIIIEKDFDPDQRGIPPGSLEEKLEFVAGHSGVSGETWMIVDEMGTVVCEHEL